LSRRRRNHPPAACRGGFAVAVDLKKGVAVAVVVAGVRRAVSFG